MKVHSKWAKTAVMALAFSSTIFSVFFISWVLIKNDVINGLTGLLILVVTVFGMLLLMVLCFCHASKENKEECSKNKRRGLDK